MPADTPLERTLAHVDALLARVERLLAAHEPPAPDAFPADALATLWRRRDGAAAFHPVRHLDVIRLCDLIGIERQLEKLVRNTRQFLAGAPANHVLLWGERGTGKSSAIKALLPEFSSRGLRLVQVHRHDLLDLPDIVDRLWDRPEKFLLFCDDLSFEADDAEYKELKALLEGSLQARPRNLLVYATSNRRHLMPERLTDSQPVIVADEVHPNEAAEERLSLADRFGLRIGFYHMDQATYLRCVHHMVAARGLATGRRQSPGAPEDLDRAAIRWSLSSAGVSGRSARQFVDDLEGRLALGE